jgi:hypothetical protein
MESRRALDRDDDGHGRAAGASGMGRVAGEPVEVRGEQLVGGLDGAGGAGRIRAGHAAPPFALATAARMA